MGSAAQVNGFEFTSSILQYIQTIQPVSGPAVAIPTTYRNYRLQSGRTGLVSTYAVNCGAIMGRKQKTAELTCMDE